MESYIKSYCHNCKKECEALIVRPIYNKEASEIEVHGICQRCGGRICRILVE